MIEALLKGITIGFLLSISIGPALFSVIKQSLNNGPKGGITFAAGIFLSDITLVIIANVFTEVFRSLRIYEKQIGIAGSIFLISIGVFYLLFKKIKINEAGKLIFKQRKRDLATIALSGFFMNLLNPAVIILWITISSSLILYSVKYKLVMYSTCLIFALMADMVKIMMAGKIRNRLTPHNIHFISKINGIILIGFGVVLLWGIIFYADKLK